MRPTMATSFNGKYFHDALFLKDKYNWKSDVDNNNLLVDLVLLF
jgi:hypothetical protein